MIGVFRAPQHRQASKVACLKYLGVAKSSTKKCELLAWRPVVSAFGPIADVRDGALLKRSRIRCGSATGEH
jgi:hypothetical protein